MSSRVDPLITHRDAVADADAERAPGPDIRASAAMPATPVRPAPSAPPEPRVWPPPASPRRIALIALWSVLFWTALGVFFGSQTYILARYANEPVTWAVALQFSMPRFLSWGILTPLIVITDRWLGAGHAIRARLLMHVPLALVFTAMALAMRYYARPLLDDAPAPSVTIYVLQRVYWDLIIYAVIAGVAVARDYAAQVRRHEHQAHTLAVQAIELQRRLAEARLHSLRSQLQPHFLFNALNTISAMTEIDPKSARRLMDQLGQLLRASLRHATTPLVTLAEELTFLDDYLAIESVRFEGRITVSVQADDDALGAMVPSFLLQPLVENAIRHGVGPRLSGGHIDVMVTRDRDRLRLRVRDNGLGLSPDYTLRREAGVGLRNAAARLDQLYPGTHAFEVASNTAGGVEVTIDLPYQAAESPAARTASAHA